MWRASSYTHVSLWAHWDSKLYDIYTIIKSSITDLPPTLFNKSRHPTIDIGVGEVAS